MLYGILITLFGLVYGSFLNVVALRTLEGRSIVRPPSQCPHCGARLSPRELIPVVSYVVQKGRCRACGARISFLYPLGEALTAALFLWLFLLWREGRLSAWEALSEAVFASLLIVVTIADLKSLRIPNPVLLFFAPVLFFLRWAADPSGIGRILLGGLLFGGVFGLIYALSRGGMGFGDVKYAAVLGLYLGPEALLPLILLASLSGFFVALALIAAGRKTRKDAVPFGPFLSLAAWVLSLYGRDLVVWYFSLW
ncbi:prepilin peptidase [Hydrogenibacillus schlegelii]|uniref:Prepilin peptidase n=1 Tax=Hydrogenibacillus schlegelii TaxID=1484 RepID=A0A132N7L2_HYDSH|nr:MULTISPECIES: A24 family peptidase [Hydrogenibacillus]KWX06141.1 hypothetical protein TR75_06950 [Hydrogenibacillus schlegelii]OAR04238.1 hypothetical protein SA87_07260 [Hydrogenibacillus schlegelii]QZA32925.1 prepilin peptidase [Hydrogenibacillus sp. N12]